MAGIAQGIPAEYKDIMSLLEDEYGESNAERLFDRFIDKGLLKERGTWVRYSHPFHACMANGRICLLENRILSRLPVQSDLDQPKSRDGALIQVHLDAKLIPVLH